MPAEDSPEVVQVPVRRHDVNLTLEDIMTPLTQAGSMRVQAKAAEATDPRLTELLQKFSELAGQLKDVASQINQIDPTFLPPQPPAG